MTDLFLLPFAGGASLMYENWQFPAGIRAIPLDYRGHGYRMREPLDDTFEELVGDLADQIRQKRSGAVLALFGHSMGGLAAWDTAVRLAEEGIPVNQVIVSACLPPHLFSEKKYTEMATDAWLETFLTEYGRMKPEKMESAFFRKRLYPAIQNDYRLLSVHRHGEIRTEAFSLACFYGQEDELMPRTGMEEWAAYTRARFCLKGFRGSHFYIEEEAVREEAIAAIEALLEDGVTG